MCGHAAAAALLLVLLLLAVAVPLSAAPTPVDTAALLAFKASLDNGDEVLRSWQAGSDPCSWDYLSCDAGGWVTRMALSSLGLRGTIPQPAGWALPPRLQSLELKANNLTGPLPPGWRLPEGCTQFSLAENPVGGPLSASWALPDSMLDVNLQSCGLTGTLPASWQLPQAIQLVALSGNQFTGTIPLNFASLLSLHMLALKDNRLTGSLPATFSFDPAAQLQGLSVQGNNLSGSIPSWPNQPRAVVFIQPGNDGLCGQVPEAPSALRFVDPVKGTGVSVTELPPCPGAGQASGQQAGLSTGVIVGAALGSAAAVAMLLAVAVWLMRRRAHQQKTSANVDLEAAAKLGGAMDQLSLPHSSPAHSVDGWSGNSSTPLAQDQPTAITSVSVQSSGPAGTFAEMHTSSTERSLADILPRLMAESSGSAGAHTTNAHGALTAPANTHHLWQQLMQLEHDPPPWLLSPSHLFMWQNAVGQLMLLGAGSFGRVYRGMMLPEAQLAPSWRDGVHSAASQPAANPSSPDPLPVAIKVMEMVDLHAFLREAGMLHRLSGSPHVVPLYGACIVQQHLMVVMELMEGGDLRDALDADAADVLSWHQQGKQISLDIASGLAYLHANNVTHRDLKSKNVLLTADLRAKLADIGTAALHSATYLSAGSSNFRGTLAWAAPELLLADPCTQKIDIFSLGVVLWEIATKQTPYRGRVVLPPASHACPQGLVDLVADCLQPQPDARPTAQQVLDRLQLL